MPHHVFLSYSRKDKKVMQRVGDDLRAQRLVVWTDEFLEIGTPRWEREIELAIKSTGVLVVLLSPDSYESEWVAREISFAEAFQKRILPLLVRGDRQTAIPIKLINYNYADIRDEVRYTTAIPGVIETICKHLQIESVTQQRQRQAQEEEQRKVEEHKRLQQAQLEARLQVEQEAQQRLAAETARREAEARQRQQEEDTRRKKKEEEQRKQAEAEARLRAEQEAQRRKVRTEARRQFVQKMLRTMLSRRVIVLFVGSVFIAAIAYTLVSQKIFNTSTATVTPIPLTTSTNPPTRIPPATFTSVPTNPPTSTLKVPTLDVTPTFITAVPKEAKITSNKEWTPVTQTINGVEMVLVPLGCFMLGDNGEGGQQCFDKPFWIDRTEVTNTQFAQFSGQAASSSAWTDPNRPRENINWFKARDFCAKRGARLPTEAEWEYAARGPDNLVYPWGNDFVANNVIYSGNSDGRTWDVGSKPGGVSWIGALDMSGNAWEWVSSIYKDYPYDPQDGRENLQDTNNTRVLRGGSWDSSTTVVRAANRLGLAPSSERNLIGFRCAADYSG